MIDNASLRTELVMIVRRILNRQLINSHVFQTNALIENSCQSLAHANPAMIMRELKVMASNVRQTSVAREKNS